MRFFDDLATAYQKAVRAFYDAGCRYLHSTTLPGRIRVTRNARARGRGDDPDHLQAIYARVTNEAMEDKPTDMTITMIPAAAISAPPSSHPGATTMSQNSARARQSRRLLPRIRHRPCRRLRAAAFFPKGNKIWCSGWSPRNLAGEREADIKSRIEEATRCRARPALSVAAMRLRLDRRRQRAGRRRTMGEATHDCRTGERSVGEVFNTRSRVAGIPRGRGGPGLSARFRGDDPGRGTYDPTHHAAFSRRSRRQPAAHGATKRCASQREKGEVDAAALKAVEDRGPKRSSKAGRCGTEGGYRRRIPPRLLEFRFLSRACGVEAYLGDRQIKFEGVETKPTMLRMTARSHFAGHPNRTFQVPESSLARRAEMTIPSPSSLHFRHGRDAVTKTVTPTWSSSPISEKPGARQSAPSTTPAAAICNSTINVTYVCDPKLREQSPTAATTPKNCRQSTRA